MCCIRSPILWVVNSRADRLRQILSNTQSSTFNVYFSHPQFAHYKDEMFITAQRAFGVTPDRHYRLLHVAAEEKPKIIVLSVIVQEAEGLEAKDANGMFKAPT